MKSSRKQKCKMLMVLVLALCFFMSTMSIQAADISEATTPTGIPLSQVESMVDELVASYMHEFTLGFAIAIVKDGEIVFSRGYGYTDMGGSTPINPATTVFEYGSIAKLFVYTSVMQLVEQGRIDLDAGVQNYLPEDLYHAFNFEKPFTVRDLLNHSAGFGEFLFYLFVDAENVETEITLREGLLMSQPAQIFEPSTASSYSNFGSALLAYIVSYVSGQDFTSFEHANILDPIGMENTMNQPDWFRSLSDNTFVESKARGHLPIAAGRYVETPWVYIPIYPAGSLRGTAEDLARFAIALTPPQGETSPLFDSRDTLDLMLSPSFSNPAVMRGMHHGFMSYDGIYPTVGHGGGTMGFNTDFAIVPSERFGVVMLTNANGGANFMEKVLDMLIGNSRDSIPDSPDNLPHASIFEGNYMMLRRNDGNILELINFAMAALSVEAIDENTINVNAMGMTLTYRQVEPYIFRLISSGSFLARTGYELQFRMENGSPVGISLSAPFDATVQTQSTVVLIIGVVVAAISIIFFLVMPIILLINLLRKKEEPSVFRNLSNGLLLCGALFSLNNLILVVRIVSDIMGVQTSMVTFHAVLNWILIVLFAALMVASLVFLKRDKICIKRKVIHFSAIAIMVLFAAFLWSWNFFVIM
ncbi:MAG: beta-lactamase family protein [Defluviitaleaceae bacterium]|nr:beta-lactamase family protein [Defluviitaleaceae bacterium]